MKVSTIEALKTLPKGFYDDEDDIDFAIVIEALESLASDSEVNKKYIALGNGEQPEAIIFQNIKFNSGYHCPYIEIL